MWAVGGIVEKQFRKLVPLRMIGVYNHTEPYLIIIASINLYDSKSYHLSSPSRSSRSRRWHSSAGNPSTDSGIQCGELTCSNTHESTIAKTSKLASVVKAVNDEPTTSGSGIESVRACVKQSTVKNRQFSVDNLRRPMYEHTVYVYIGYLLLTRTISEYSYHFICVGVFSGHHCRRRFFFLIIIFSITTLKTRTGKSVIRIIFLLVDGNRIYTM